jgi:Holliday junction resolvase RusA-like endonuclease
VIAFTVYGTPIPKARARTVRLPNGMIRSYTPAKTQDWEASIQGQALAHRPAQLLDGPLVLEATFYLLRPKSRKKSELYPDRKPDLDNMCKSITDALNGIIWTDDARIVEIVARKEYGSPPRVEIRILEKGVA